MLDIIFNGLKIDLGKIYNWGNIGIYFAKTIPQKGVNNFASDYEKMESRIQSAMEKTIDKFDKVQ